MSNTTIWKDLAHFLVRWKIDIEAESPREAAETALRIQRRPDSIAKVFDVLDDNGKNTPIDLGDEPDVEIDWKLFDDQNQRLSELAEIENEDFSELAKVLNAARNTQA